jgi:YD repeat-containing protein
MPLRDHTGGKKLFAQLPVRQTTYGSDGNKYAESRSTYASTATATPGVTFVHLTETRSLNFNGDNSEANAVKSKSTYSYGTYGDPVLVTAYGEVGADWADVYHDKTETASEYAVDTSRWLVLPSRQTVSAYDLAGTFGVASERRFFYYSGDSDNDFGETIAAAGNPGTKGLLARVENENGANDVSQELAYYPHGNLWKTKDARGNIAATLTYDADYDTLVESRTDALGHTAVNDYDGLRRLVEAENEREISSYLSYDAFGRVQKALEYGDSETSPTKRSTYVDTASLPGSPAYVESELRNSETDYLTSRTYVDGLGRKLQTKTELETSGQFAAVDFHYDAAGRLYRTSLPYVSGSISFNYGAERSSPSRAFFTTYFDEIGRPWREEAADGSSTYRIYGQRYRATVDGEGHVSATEVAGSEGYAYSYLLQDYTGLSYAAMKSAFAGDKDSWYRQVRTRKGRDGTIVAERSAASPTENVITVTLDMLGRKTVYDDPDMGTWLYQYDGNGNLVYQQDAMGQVVRFEYDALNRPTAKKHEDTQVAGYSYTLTGRPLTVSYSGGSDAYSYDERDRLTGITRSLSGYGAKTVSMSYDSMGRVRTQTYPDGEVVTYTYNGGGNLETAAGVSSYVTGVDYNQGGKVTQLGLGNGKASVFTYNALSGRLTDIDVAGVVDLHYGYDAVGNVLAKDDLLAPQRSESYGYDALNRLTNALGVYGSKSYAYDAYNNKDPLVYHYPAAGQDRPHAVDNDAVNAS